VETPRKRCVGIPVHAWWISTGGAFCTYRSDFLTALKPLVDFTCMCLFIQLVVNLPKLLLFISFPLGVEYFTYFIFLSIILFLRGFSTCIILPVWHMQQNLRGTKIVTFARRAASRSVSGRDNPKLQHCTKFIPRWILVALN
jgi:hypothetical protein